MAHPTFIYLASQSPRRRELLEQIGVRYQGLVAADDEDSEALETRLDAEPAPRYVMRVCAAKAAAARLRLARRGLANAPILCADTTVSLDDDILGKPRDAREAVEMITRLQGRAHQVLTAVTLSWRAGGFPSPLGTTDAACPTARSLPVTAPQLTATGQSLPHEAIAAQLNAGARSLFVVSSQPDGSWHTVFALSASLVRFCALTQERIAAYVDSAEPFGKAGAYGIQGRAAEFVMDLRGSHSGVMGLPLFETAALLRHAGVDF